MALPPLPRLLGWCMPLTALGGSVLALKGRSAQEEVDQESASLARRRLRVDVLSVRAHESSEPTTVVRVRRA